MSALCQSFELYVLHCEAVSMCICTTEICIPPCTKKGNSGQWHSPKICRHLDDEYGIFSTNPKYSPGRVMEDWRMVEAERWKQSSCGCVSGSGDDVDGPISPQTSSPERTKPPLCQVHVWPELWRERTALVGKKKVSSLNSSLSNIRP